MIKHFLFPIMLSLGLSGCIGSMILYPEDDGEFPEISKVPVHPGQPDYEILDKHALVMEQKRQETIAKHNDLIDNKIKSKDASADAQFIGAKSLNDTLRK